MFSISLYPDPVRKAGRHRRLWTPACLGVGRVASPSRTAPGARSPIPADALAEFYTSALLGLLTWWINTDFRGDPDYVASLYAAMAVPGIQNAVTPGP
jgi:hypothetical protein